MKYKCSIEIDLPIDKTALLWDNEEYFPKWQDGFKSIELLKGKKNEVGSTSKIILEQGKRRIELIETIMIYNLPREKTALYEHTHMTNIQRTIFKKLEENKTEFISEVEYTKFNGFMPKLMSFLFPKMFKNQSLKWMKQFKEFAEG